MSGLQAQDGTGDVEVPAAPTREWLESNTAPLPSGDQEQVASEGPDFVPPQARTLAAQGVTANGEILGGDGLVPDPVEEQAITVEEQQSS